jgi:hypothetical protein
VEVIGIDLKSEGCMQLICLSLFSNRFWHWTLNMGERLGFVHDKVMFPGPASSGHAAYVG